MGFVFGLLVLVVAVAASKEHRGKWLLEREAPSNEAVGVYFALKQRNLDEFDRRFVQISTPGSGHYGKWMGKDEILDIIAPPTNVSESFMSWIRSSCSPRDIVTLENRRDVVYLQGRVCCLTRLLQVRLGQYKHTVKGGKCIRLHPASRSPRIPKNLNPHLELIEGLSILPPIRHKKVVPLNRTIPLTPDSPDATYNYIWIGSINQRYNVQSNKVTQARATQAVMEFIPEGAPSLQDLQTYDQWSQIPFTNVSYIMGPWSVGNNGESLLDIQLISAVAQTPTAYISIPDGWTVAMAQTIFNIGNPPAVVSVSYGWPELLTCQSDVTNAHCNSQQDPKEYVFRSEIEIKKAAARGVSWSICSQDEGAPSENNNYCSLDSTQPVWSIYPGCSAYATSVSATTLVSNSASSLSSRQSAPICQQGYTCGTGNLELPCTVANTYYGWTTGGGFSSYIPTPTWQKTLVTQYLNKPGLKFPPSGTFNNAGRMYPDVAAFGSRILVVSGGSISISAGTSASTPIIAGIMTLINEARLKAGKSTIGFFNPALYQAFLQCPTCFNNVPSGDNRCTEGQCCEYGYYVAPSGSNAVTGLGTINVANLIKFMVALD